VEEVTDEPLYRDRACGIDIGKAGLVATIRVPSDRDPARRMQETRSFGTTKREVLALADWLRCWQVPAVVMEATGDYWKGPFYRLEAEGFECVLADAKQVKNLPGRPKRDPADSRWLAACFERGAITSCFVATPEFRIIRLHTRDRRDLTEERTREKQRAEKLLESAAIKISSVLTDLHGVTGRDIMDRLIAGERNPNRYLGAITGETAVAAGRTQTREGARHRRLARRRGTAKACVATGNTQLKVYHKLLSNPGMRYQDLGPDYYDRQRDTRRQVAHHIGKLGSLGFEVTLCRIPEPGPDGTAPTQSA
jgi:transposase